MRVASHTFEEHTGEVLLRLRAPTLEEIFVEAGRGLAELLAGEGYFWPIWPIMGWGIGLFFHWYGTYREKDITEAQIQAEIEQLRRQQGS